MPSPPWPARAVSVRWLPRTRVLAGVAIALGAALTAALAVAEPIASPDPGAFHPLMDAAMVKMHHNMHIAPSGDVDRDFARMMIPHHQGAVDMAVLELRFGRDLRLRRLAQEIIVTQGQEIQLMSSLLGEQKGR